MKSPSATEQWWRGRHLKITRAKPIERDRRVCDAIAQKALQTCDGEAFASGHPTEVWERVKSEMLRPLDCGFLTLDNGIELTTNASSFGEGEIEICVEPQRLTLCGKAEIPAPSRPKEKAGSNGGGDTIFRYLNLPFPVEPSQVTANFKGCTLEIRLPKAHTVPEVAKGKSAA